MNKEALAQRGCCAKSKKKRFEMFTTVGVGLISVRVGSGIKFQLIVICTKMFTVNLGHVVPEVVLNVEAFLIITTECFSGL